MTTHASMAVPRQPFSPLNSPRLQYLQSSKNRQNGTPSPLSDTKAAISPAAPSKLTSSAPSQLTWSAPSKTTTINPPAKRRYSPSENDDYDSENIDPSSFNGNSNKRSKISADGGSPFSKTSLFNLVSKSTSSPAPVFSFTAASSKSSSSLMAAPSAIPARLIHTPPSSRGYSPNAKRTTLSSPRVPLTAPAGRSPTRSRRLGQAGSRRVSAPFTRIDPPSFSLTSCGASSSSAALPFSLDAALAGTVPSCSASKSASVPSLQQPPAAAVSAKSSGKLLEETMPNDWFFDIYEDTPDEEAANLMEHSTLILDLSSDDETSSKQTERHDRGKENVAPEDDALPVNSRSRTQTTTSRANQSLLRRKLVKPDDMDDGQRSPLSDLDTEDFFADGLTKESCIVIPPTPENNSASVIVEQPEEQDHVVCAKVESETDEETLELEKDQVADLPVFKLHAAGPAESEILIWEDDATSASA